jgi:alkanesulfonate monooxygenase SsuD/methylene tetrahydromethanopterin reductase-like flavin-dependent oxidoreductase (luciferase family)
MRFGLWYDFRNPARWYRPAADLYARTLDQIVRAEELGFDDIWLSEHHFVDDGYLPSCLPVAAAIAARTQRVAIGTNVLLTPFHNPIRLAEDCAVVDIMSNGRFVLGAAVAYRLEEFATFGVDRRQRGSITEEAVEIIRRCWTEDEFSYHGRHFDYDGIRCFPKPVQQPIPIWFGATQGEAIRRAARQGVGLLGGGPGRVPYLEAREEYGKNAGEAHVASSTGWLFCSEDPKRDWDVLKPHALYQLQNYAAWFMAAGQPAFGDPPTDFGDLEARGLYLCGTPDQIIEDIRSAYERAPFERHFFWAIWPGVDPDMATRSIELFAREVMPKLRSL